MDSGQGWTIHAAAQAPDGAEQTVDDYDLAGLLDVLHYRGGSVSGGGDRYEATFSIEEDGMSVFEAAYSGGQLFEQAVEKAGLPAWPIVRLEVITFAEQDADLERPMMPELAGVAEAAEILRVARQRIGELMATHEHFPRPIAELAATKVWDAAALRSYDEQWERKPGRPSAKMSATSKSGRSSRAGVTGRFVKESGKPRAAMRRSPGKA